MKRFIQAGVVGALVLVLAACIDNDSTAEKIVGTWKSEWVESITLAPDNTGEASFVGDAFRYSLKWRILDKTPEELELELFLANQPKGDAVGQIKFANDQMFLSNFKYYKFNGGFTRQ